VNPSPSFGAMGERGVLVKGDSDITVSWMACAGALEILFRFGFLILSLRPKRPTGSASKQNLSAT